MQPHLGNDGLCSNFRLELQSMTSLCKSRKARKRADPPTLPLFEYADAIRVRDLPPAARRLARRWGLAPSTARNIAELAGFSTERE